MSRPRHRFTLRVTRRIEPLMFSSMFVVESDLRSVDGRPSLILVLTMHEHIDIASEALAAGAGGYALKNQSYTELIEAIRIVADGGRYLAPRLPRELLDGDENSTHSQSHGVLWQLSAREHEVFDLIVSGHSNSRIAAHLFISAKTVDTHRTHVMRKLDVHSVGEMIRLAARHGSPASARRWPLRARAGDAPLSVDLRG